MTEKTHSLALKLDASAAEIGARQFAAAIAAVKAAVLGLERDTNGLFTSLQKIKIKIDTSQITQVKSGTDSATTSVSRFDVAASKSADSIRRLALSAAGAWRTSEAQAARLTSRLTDIGNVDGVARITAQLATLKTALGSATTPLGVREARSEYADLANTLNITSLAAQDAKWAATQLANAEKEAGKAAAQHKVMLDALRAEFNPLFAQSKQYESALERIATAEREGAISATLAGQARAKAAASLSGNTSGFDNVGKAANRMQYQIQNASYQVGDFFVQIASGTSAARAATQQLPQLLGGLGVGGAVAGAVAAIGGALLPVLLNGGPAAKTFDTAMSDLTSTFNSYKDAVSGVNGGTDALRGEFGKAAVSAQAFQMQLTQITRIKMESEMADSVKALAAEMAGVTGEMNNWDNASFLPAAMRSDTIALAAAATKKLRDEFGLTVNQARGITDAMSAAKLAKGPEELSAAMSRVVAGLIKAKNEGANLPAPLVKAAEDAVTLGLSADRLAGLLAPLPGMVGSVVGQTDSWARAMSSVGAEVSGILNSLSSISGGVISNAAKRAQIMALDAGHTIKESETERQRTEFNLQQAPLESAAKGKGGIGGFIDSGLLAAERYQFEEGLKLSATLDDKLSAARKAESAASRGSGGRVQGLGEETGQLARLSKETNKRIYDLGLENESLQLLATGQASTEEGARLMAVAMRLNGGQMDAASTSTLQLYNAQLKLNATLKKNAVNPLRDYVNSLPTMISATKQASADIASTLKDGISSAMTGEFNLKGLVDGLRHKLADGLAGALTGKLLGGLGLGDTTGSGAYSNAILTSSMAGAQMFATAISTGSMAGAGATAAGGAAGGGGGILGGIVSFIGGLFGYQEGGYVGAGVGPKHSLPVSAFHNAPHFKEGGLTGGGIPAVLHPNEAVIPLSRGRKIPVEMPAGSGGSKDGGNTVNITTNVSVEAGGGGGSAEQAGAAAERIAMLVSLKVQEEMATQMRYGGSLNPRGGR